MRYFKLINAISLLLHFNLSNRVSATPLSRNLYKFENDDLFSTAITLAPTDTPTTSSVPSLVPSKFPSFSPSHITSENPTMTPVTSTKKTFSNLSTLVFELVFDGEVTSIDSEEFLSLARVILNTYLYEKLPAFSHVDLYTEARKLRHRMLSISTLSCNGKIYYDSDKAVDDKTVNKFLDSAFVDSKDKFLGLLQHAKNDSLRMVTDVKMRRLNMSLGSAVNAPTAEKSSNPNIVIFISIGMSVLVVVVATSLFIRHSQKRSDEKNHKMISLSEESKIDSINKILADWKLEDQPISLATDKAAFERRILRHQFNKLLMNQANRKLEQLPGPGHPRRRQVSFAPEEIRETIHVYDNVQVCTKTNTVSEAQMFKIDDLDSRVCEIAKKTANDIRQEDRLHSSSSPLLRRILNLPFLKDLRCVVDNSDILSDMSDDDHKCTPMNNRSGYGEDLKSKKNPQVQQVIAGDIPVVTEMILKNLEGGCETVNFDPFQLKTIDNADKDAIPNKSSIQIIHHRQSEDTDDSSVFDFTNMKNKDTFATSRFDKCVIGNVPAPYDELHKSPSNASTDVSDSGSDQAQQVESPDEWDAEWSKCSV